MLSADVPEFVPRGYQSPSSTNTANLNPEARPSQSQQSIATLNEENTPFILRSGPSADSKSSPQGERKNGMLSLLTDSQKRDDEWKQSEKDSSRHGEGQTPEVYKHESGTAILPKDYSGIPDKKKPEKQISQKGKGRPKAMSTEDFEFSIRKKLVTAPSNLTLSYTRILKNNNPKNRTPELKSGKSEDFSLNTDSQWPALGEPQPLYISDQNKDAVKRENISNPWVCGSNEASPTKSFVNKPENSWQERSAGEQATNTSVRPRTTKENHIPPENYVKTKSAVQNLRNLQTADPSLDIKTLGSKNKQEATNQMDEGVAKPRRQNSNSNALNTENKKCDGRDNQEEAPQFTSNTTIEDHSDLFQWKVIGEKKKKDKLKKQEVTGSLQFQAPLRGDGKKYGRVLPDKPSLGAGIKQSLKYPCKNTKKSVVDLSKSKSLHSTSSQEKHSEDKKDPPAPETGQKEGKKPRPTKVISLANCSSDKRETRSSLKRSTTMAAAKPVDEETLNRRLAAKLIKQEEKRKMKELKAQQALIHSRPKDTKVSFITTDFLEKTQTCYQTSVHRTSHQINSSHERTAFSNEEYPALHLLSNTAPNLYLNKNAQDLPMTQRPKKIAQELPPTPLKIKDEDIVLSQNKPSSSSSDKADITSEEHATSYRTVLLAAKEKDITSESSNTELNCNTHTDTTQKKKVRTTDLIELDLLALAAQSGKKKKKKKELLADKFSPIKRKLFDEDEENDPVSKTGSAVHTTVPKGAAVVAKRGKISTKPKKKKISRIKKCQMEKKQKEMLALQLLLQQAKCRVEQQGSLEAPPAPRTETEKPDDEADVASGENLSEPLNSITETVVNTHRDKIGLDIDYEKVNQEKSEWLTGDNVKNIENARTSEKPCSPIKTKSQTLKNPAENENKKTKFIWDIKSTENMAVQKETQVPPQTINSNKKDGSNEEEKSSGQQSKAKDSPKSPKLPDYKELLEDPQIVEKAAELITLVKSQKLSSKGPREYVHQVVTPEVNNVAKELMQSLIAFQTRHFQRDPTKARIRKRYVCGLKETTKLMGKMSCVIMAPNIQQCEGPGSLDDAVEKLLNQAEQHKVPVVFALSIRIMRNLCHKQGKRVSCFGIISYQGAQDIFQRLMQLLPEAQKQYQQLVATGQCTLPKEEDEEEEEAEEGEKCQPMRNGLTEEIIAHTNALLMAP